MTEPRTEVLNDVDGPARRELWTDGEWVKVGRDVEDPALCLTFRADDDHYDDFRYGDHPFRTTITDDRLSDETYLVDCQSMGEFRFFKGDNLVLRVNDHELGTIRYAYKVAHEVQQQEFDWDDHARSYVKSLLSKSVEVDEIDVTERLERASVTVRDSWESVDVNEAFVESVKEAEHTQWLSVGHDISSCDGRFEYKFMVNLSELVDGDT